MGFACKTPTIVVVLLIVMQLSPACSLSMGLQGSFPKTKQFLAVGKAADTTGAATTAAAPAATTGAAAATTGAATTGAATTGAATTGAATTGAATTAAAPAATTGAAGTTGAATTAAAPAATTGAAGTTPGAATTAAAPAAATTAAPTTAAGSAAQDEGFEMGVREDLYMLDCAEFAGGAMPSLQGKTPFASRTGALINFTTTQELYLNLNYNRSDCRAVNFIGKIVVQQPGNYTFILKAYGQAVLRIQDTVVINKTNITKTSKAGNFVVENPGSVWLGLDYFNQGPTAKVVMKWIGPDTNNEKLTIPPEAYEHRIHPKDVTTAAASTAAAPAATSATTGAATTAAAPAATTGAAAATTGAATTGAASTAAAPAATTGAAAATTAAATTAAAPAATTGAATTGAATTAAATTAAPTTAAATTAAA